MDKNFITAILLTIVVIIIFTSPQYQKRFGKELPPEPAVESVTPDSKRITGISSGPFVREDKLSLKPETKPSQEEAALSSDIIVQLNRPEKEEIIAIENDDIAVDFSSRGGAIVQAIMKKYSGENESVPAQLVFFGQTWCSGSVSDDNLALSFSDIIFNVQNYSKKSVTFVADLSTNARIIRIYSLDSEGFMVHTKTAFEGEWNDPVVRFEWNGPINDTEAPVKKLFIYNFFPFNMFSRGDDSMYSKISFLGQGDRMTARANGKNDLKRIYSKEGAQKLEFKKEPGASDTFDGDLDWYAVRNKYFMTAAIPQDNKRWKAFSEAGIIDNKKWFNFNIEKARSRGDTGLDLYMGPISYDTLKNYNIGLTEIMELSWRFIRPLSIIFLWIIKKLYKIIPNWGIVIIAFSVFIKIILFPLSRKSLKSMHKMSNLQPQINELKEKHKNNSQKQHAEMMALYKREGINPFGGCFPLLLQMPVFFALFPVIGHSFELRQAMFIPHWIEDLSRPDPFYILPLAMGLSMFFQSKATMKDPNQKAMLYVMPVMMVIIFSNFGSGLTLYWFMFNIMTLFQQKMIKA